MFFYPKLGIDFNGASAANPFFNVFGSKFSIFFVVNSDSPDQYNTKDNNKKGPGNNENDDKGWHLWVLNVWKKNNELKPYIFSESTTLETHP